MSDRFADRISTSSMRVVFVFWSLELGGAERQGLLLARYLIHQLNVHVVVWGLCGPGRTADLCEEYGIPWRVVPFTWYQSRTKRLRNLVEFAWALRCARPDVILPYTGLPNVLCGLIWRWTGARLCIWNQRDHGLWRLTGRMGRVAERLAILQTPWFVSNSWHGAEFLSSSFGIRPSQIRVIQNGVELATPVSDRAAWRRRLAVDEDAFLVCMIANLNAHKDHATLLRAWRQVINLLDRSGRQAMLLLAGRFDDTFEPLEELTINLGLCKSVHFLGEVDDISGLLGTVDLGVLSSRSEGCPNGLLEAMASGLAVVGTDTPGIREAVGTDGHPFLAFPGDVDALADRILMLARDPYLRARLGALNRQRVRTQFSPQKMCEQIVSLIPTGLSKS